MHQRKSHSLNHVIQHFEEMHEAVKQKMKELLKGKTKGQMKKILLQEFEIEDLEHICIWSLPIEDCKICEAVKEVVNEQLTKILPRHILP